MSILGDKRLVPKKSADLYIYNIQYIDTTTDHITPCSRMRARGNNTRVVTVPELGIAFSLCRYSLAWPASFLLGKSLVKCNRAICSADSAFNAVR